MTLSHAEEIEDVEWGCAYQYVLNSEGHQNIKLCFVKIKNLNEFATRITDTVLDNSWMTSLDLGTRRAYETTARETANALVDIFRKTSAAGSISADFGEVMVSISSARALEQTLAHVTIPIAELWKPQLKQNEGFDFHTLCKSEYINFGEAKYSGKGNPHGLAISQANDFLRAEKHLRDRVHLVNLVDASSIRHLDHDTFGVVAAFSINSEKPLLVLENALKSAAKMVSEKNLTNFYLVGVIDEC